MSESRAIGSGLGRITSGIAAGRLVARTLEFVHDQLPPWRDDPSRERVESEVQLNVQLCKFLNASARQLDFSMVHFHHEEPQTDDRRVDLSALPVQPMWIGPKHHSVYEPFLVMEGKRLPAPSKDREQEYVIGHSKPTGGIQRFKLGLHGASLEIAAMIGYVQKGKLPEWHGMINGWIADLAREHGASDFEWSLEEQLQDFSVDASQGIASCDSIHSRISPASDSTQLRHLWIAMENR